jgi:hypothetical protein
MLEHL